MVQGLLLIPLYVKFLGQDLYGFWLASGGLLAWASMVDVGGTSIARQRCANAYANKEFRRMLDYFYNGVAFAILTFTIFLIVLISVAPHIQSILNTDDEFIEILTHCFLIAGLGTGLLLLKRILKEFTSALQRVLLPVIFDILGLLLSLLFIISGIVYFNLGLYALAFGALIRVGVPFILNIFYVAVLLYGIRGIGLNLTMNKAVIKDYVITTPSVFLAKSTGSFSTQIPIILLRLRRKSLTVV